MKFDVPCVLHEPPTKLEWKALYPENGFQAKLAYRAAQKVYIRNRLAEAQNWRCCWCAGITVPESGQHDSATIEHVIPRCEGGADHPDNYAMSCSDCNRKRGTKSVELFMEILEGRWVIPVSKAQRQQDRRAKRHDRRAQVLEMLQGGANQFPEGSKEHRMFERYRNSAHIQTAMAA